ncbi:MAG: hypothetical protein RLY93_14375 [Sumerlaeia bacterium]
MLSLLIESLAFLLLTALGLHLLSYLYAFGLLRLLDRASRQDWFASLEAEQRYRISVVLAVGWTVLLLTALIVLLVHLF